MSMDDVQTIISRAVMEPDYRNLLFDNPDSALEGYNLNEQESSALKKLEREKFDAAASELEERVSRAGIGGMDPSSMKIPDKVARSFTERFIQM